MTNQSVEMYAGEYKTLVVSVTDSTGAEKVITGGTAKFQSSKICKGATISGSVITVVLEPEDTANLSGQSPFKIWVVDAEKRPEVVVDGTLYIL